jgi:hypothetical protein
MSCDVIVAATAGSCTLLGYTHQDNCTATLLCVLVLQRLPYNQHCCGSGKGADGGSKAACLAPLGGVLQLELLAVPPPAKHSRGWTVHQVNGSAMPP